MRTQFKLRLNKDGGLDPSCIEEAGLVWIQSWLQNRFAGSDHNFPIDKRVDEAPETLIVGLIQDLGLRHPAVQMISRAILSLLDLARIKRRKLPAYFDAAVSVCQRAKIPYVSSWFIEELRMISATPNHAEADWHGYERVKNILFAAILQAPGIPEAVSRDYWYVLLRIQKYSTLALLGLSQRFADKVAILNEWWVHCPENDRIRELDQVILSGIRMEGSDSVATALRSNEAGISPELKIALNAALEVNGLSPCFAFPVALELVSDESAQVAARSPVVSLLPDRSIPARNNEAIHTFISDHLVESITRDIPRKLSQIGQEPPQTQIDGFKVFFQGLNGADRHDVGERLGRAIAIAQLQYRMPKATGDVVARCLIRAAYVDERSKRSLLSAYLVKSRARELLKQAESGSDELLVKELNKFGDLQSYANKVKRAAKTSDVSELVVAVTQYHEDRILASLLTAVLRGVGMHGFLVKPRRWGSLQTKTAGEADFGIISKAQVESNDFTDVSEPLYRFTGYYAFARREWIEDLAKCSSNESMERIKTCCLKLLEGSNTIPVADNDQDIPALCWISLQGGMFQNRGNGFLELTGPIREFAKKIGQPLTRAPFEGDARQCMEEEFESFLKGGVDVFMGGAVHSRLLRRWWGGALPDPPFVELLNPRLINSITGKYWNSENCLAFAQEAFKEGKKTGPLRDAIKSLYRQIAKTLNTLANVSPNRVHGFPIFRYLVRMLVANEFGDDESEWSFVTEEEDIALLLKEDNDAWSAKAAL